MSDRTVAEQPVNMSENNVLDSAAVDEARRQIHICNACRYCEGYCSVFPAINRQRAFATGDITQLANLCHNCRGCYYACQYTEPHEFKVNLPKALAEVRTESWESFVKPRRLAEQFQQRGVVLALAAIAGLAALFGLAWWLPSGAGNGFYATLSHSIMVTIFLPAFVLPIIVIGQGVRDYWRNVGGEQLRLRHVYSALTSAAQLKNLSGGQGQGCNYELEDRFTNRRRWLHQATMLGFLLCFASTTAGTVMHYMLASEAPYNLLSVPKLLGVPGGLLLSVGSFGLAWLKIRADRTLSEAGVWGGEMAFVLLLGATGATGLVLYAATGTAAVPALLAIHLGTVLTFFLTMPYTKMVHGFFRMAALMREAQLQSENI